MAPLLERYLGCQCVVPADLDTDQLGTFSGEIPRRFSPIEAARRKCRMALSEIGGDLCIASEGSFGSHPSLPFQAANEELVLLVDSRNGFEVSASKVSFQTNFNGQAIVSLEELQSFAEKALFPSHGLIIRKNPKSDAGIVKGINTWPALQIAFESTMNTWGQVYVETDMRAMHNPLRMETIRAATIKLIHKLQNSCAVCGAPGFGVVRQAAGLPCSVCSQPTKSVMASTYGCQLCHFEEHKLFPQDKPSEGPAYCDYCNP
ncbi:MAG: DUF6671 family protein [Imperialibacter sp.]|uniref:DUF6671 family protein n=1 Tax=Imperialibacter sp. TaxID=2038411 RepID=UPI0030D7552B